MASGFNGTAEVVGPPGLGGWSILVDEFDPKPALSCEEFTQCTMAARCGQRQLWNVGPRSLWLDVRKLDHLGPFSRLVGDEFAKSAGEPLTTVPPRSTSRAAIRGSAITALMCSGFFDVLRLGIEATR
jgi:hypothetical protein